MNKSDLVIGGKYNWKSQPERLIYIGRDWTGRWNRFGKVETPHLIWCEVLDEDLHMMEPTE